MCSSNRQNTARDFTVQGQLEGIYWPLGIQFKLKELWSSQTKDVYSQLHQRGWHWAPVIQTGTAAGAKALGQEGAGLFCGAKKEVLWIEMEPTRESTPQSERGERLPHLGSH